MARDDVDSQGDAGSRPGPGYDEALGALPQHLVDFLRHTACFEELTSDRCDGLLGTSTAAQTLAELDRRGVTTPSPSPGPHHRPDQGPDHRAGPGHRLDDAVRRRLETELLHVLPGPAVWSRYRAAARLLRLDQEHAAAVRVLARVGDWGGVRELLARRGDVVVAAPAGWVLDAPARVLDGDPWMLLAQARRHLDEGRLEAAAGAARRAEESAVDLRGRRLAAGTAGTAEAWLGLPRSGSTGWGARLHDATVRDPAGRTPPDTPDLAPAERLGRALTLALAGDLAGARTELDRVLHSGLDERTNAVARLARAAISSDVSALGTLLTDRDRPDHPWLTRVAQALVAAHHALDRPDELDMRLLRDDVVERDDADDAWGALALCAIRATTLLRGGRPSERAFEDLAHRAHAAGSTTLEAWARATRALAAAAAGRPAAGRARAAEDFARGAGVPGALALATAALALESGEADVLARATATADQVGLDVRPWEWLDARGAVAAAPPAAAPVVAPQTTRDIPPRATVTDEHPVVSVQCLGGFRLRIRGREPHLSRVGPRARDVLRLLALEPGRTVPNQRLLDAFWRDADPVAAAHSLHVSVSSLRSVLEPGVPRSAGRILVRDGDGYRLDLPAGSFSDLVALDRALAEADAALVTGASAEAVDALERAVAGYAGEVLPEDGPAEWVVGAREHYRTRVARAGARLAELHLERHDPSAAVRAALRSIDLDPSGDGSWRLLAAGYTALGDLAAAERTHSSRADTRSTGTARQPGSTGTR